MHYLKTFLILGSLLGFGFVLWRQLLTTQARAWIDYRFAAVVPLVGVGLYTPNLWIYYGAIFVAMVLLPRTRVEAAGLYIFLALMLPLVSYDLRVGSTSIIRLEGHMVAALGLLTAFRFPGSKSKPGAGGDPLTAIVILFMVLQVIIDTRIAMTSTTTALRNVLATGLALGIPYFLVSTSAYRENDLRRPLFYLIAAGFILSIVATFEMFRHWPLYQTIESNLGTTAGLSKTLAVRGGLLRAPGPFFESTTFGVFLAITTICAAAMRSIFRSGVTQLVATAIGCVGCFATLSRNAWIGLILGLIVAGLYRGRVGKAAGAGALVVMAAAALIVVAPSSGLTASLVGKGDTTAASTATYRQNLFTKSMPLINNSPWTGTPYDRVRNMLESEMTSGALKVDYVNSYLYYAVTTGLIGLFVFLAFIFYPIYTLLASRYRLLSRATEMETAAALLSAQVALAFMIIGTSFFERIPVFAILLIGMTRLVIVRAGRSTSDPPAPAMQAGSVHFLVMDPMQPKRTPREA